ncbi:MAG TPA: SDR family NAD(P)-dependent oxidoreductase [Roseiflexaceae bacterium]|nr:SDR family NAD(P)-dependent oxidoreductase [Roseiflexaceae bacterium]
MSMTIDLIGRTALVTGGNTGIGRAIARTLAKAGADVAITYFSNADEQTVAEIRGMGRTAAAAQLDATDSAAVNRVVPELARALGGHIDILVNNAGHLIGRMAVAGMTDEHWHNVLDVNLSSAFYCARAALPFMNTGWGRIVQMSSLAGRNGGGTGAVAYGAAKAGLFGFTRGLAKEVAAQGITVNAVAPGLILDTPFHEKFTPPESQQATIASLPVKRAGLPDDVAGAVLFLVSDMAGFITGEVTEINGGAWFV